jgi:hypothetical protein
MKHYGDITKINGASVEPVNVIIGGSPWTITKLIKSKENK